MKTKKIANLLLTVILVLTTFANSACGNEAKDSATDLEIYCTDAGYKTEWVSDIIDLFKQQAWVKEKYPELTVTLSTNDDQTFASSRLDAGAKANTIDLLFGLNMWGYSGEGSYAQDLTEGVYNTKVPGENILYKDKMQESYVLSNQ